MVAAGCGNFHEEVSQDDWRVVGTNEPPLSTLPEEFEVTTLRAGTGPLVRAGVLVHARVLATTSEGDEAIPSNPWPVDAWLWTGRSPEPDGDWEAALSFGDLGSARVRAALMDHAVGQGIGVRLPDGAARGGRDPALRAVRADLLT